MSDVKFDERWFEGRQGADLLTEKLHQVLNQQDKRDLHDEIGEALCLVAGLIGDIESASRRANMVKAVPEILADLLEQALQRPKPHHNQPG
jgi:hypothetical protein